MYSTTAKILSMLDFIICQKRISWNFDHIYTSFRMEELIDHCYECKHEFKFIMCSKCGIIAGLLSQMDKYIDYVKQRDLDLLKYTF